MSATADQPAGAPDEVPVGELLEKLADQPATVASVEVLASVDPVSLDAGAKVDYLKALQRAQSWLDGLGQHALAAIDAGSGAEPLTPTGFDDDWAREQVGAALRLAPMTAKNRLHVARALVRRFPATLRALEQGRVGYLHAMVLIDAAMSLPADQYGEYERRVLPAAERLTVGKTGRLAEKVAAELDPLGAEERHESCRADRRVTMAGEPHAMASVSAYLGADAAVIVMAALNGLADAQLAEHPDDPRSMDQLRADLFAEVFDAIRTGSAVPAVYFPTDPDDDPDDPLTDPGGDDDPDGDGGRGSGGVGVRKPAAEATAPRRGRVGRRKAKRRELLVRPAGDGAGELDGYGPVPQTVIDRLLARDKVHVPTSADEIGDLDFDWGTYRPPATLDRYARQRDRTCTFPGCSRRAALCDLDHIDPWPDGPTSANNLHCLCRRHHRLKTLGFWKVRRDPDGGLTWTAPTGHQYRAPPAT